MVTSSNTIVYHDLESLGIHLKMLLPTNTYCIGRRERPRYKGAPPIRIFS